MSPSILFSSTHNNLLLCYTHNNSCISPTALQQNNKTNITYNHHGYR